MKARKERGGSAAASGSLPGDARAEIAKLEQLLDANRSRKRSGAPLPVQLRALRERQELSGTLAASKAGIAQPRLSKIETGQALPSPAELERLLRVYDADPEEREVIRGRAEAASADFPRTLKTVGHLELDVIQEQWRIAEGASRELRVFHHSLVPGLLQIKPYARAALAHGDFANRSDLEHALHMRMTRRAELDEPDKRFYFVLTAAALETSLGLSPDVLVRQLQKIKHLATTRNIEIAIVPFENMSFIPMDNFHLMDDDLVTIENYAVEVLSDHPAYVKTYRDFFDRAWEAATKNDEEGRVLELIDDAIRRLGPIDDHDEEIQMPAGV